MCAGLLLLGNWGIIKKKNSKTPQKSRPCPWKRLKRTGSRNRITLFLSRKQEGSMTFTFWQILACAQTWTVKKTTNNKIGKYRFNLQIFKKDPSRETILNERKSGCLKALGWSWVLVISANFPAQNLHYIPGHEGAAVWALLCLPVPSVQVEKQNKMNPIFCWTLLYFLFSFLYVHSHSWARIRSLQRPRYSLETGDPFVS